MGTHRSSSVLGERRRPRGPTHQPLSIQYLLQSYDWLSTPALISTLIRLPPPHASTTLSFKLTQAHVASPRASFPRGQFPRRQVSNSLTLSSRGLSGSLTGPSFPFPEENARGFTKGTRVVPAPRRLPLPRPRDPSPKMRPLTCPVDARLRGGRRGGPSRLGDGYGLAQDVQSGLAGHLLAFFCFLVNSRHMNKSQPRAVLPSSAPSGPVPEGQQLLLLPLARLCGSAWV